MVLLSLQVLFKECLSIWQSSIT